MQGIVYHGSNNGELDELFPNESTHQKKCIYAAEERVVPLLFMSRGNGDLDLVIGSQDGNLYVVERRENIFESRFIVEGYLYELSGDTFEHYDFLWSKEVISFAPSIKPLKKVVIPNVYKEILEEEKRGNIKLYHYPDRPNNIPLDNSDLIDKYVDFEKKGITGAIDHLLRIYPEFEDIVKERLIESHNIKKL